MMRRSREEGRIIFYSFSYFLKPSDSSFAYSGSSFERRYSRGVSGEREEGV
jgi:hypothetical protein